MSVKENKRGEGVAGLGGGFKLVVLHALKRLTLRKERKKKSAAGVGILIIGFS